MTQNADYVLDVTRNPDVIAAAAAALERIAKSARAHGYKGLAEELLDIHGMLFVEVERVQIDGSAPGEAS